MTTKEQLSQLHHVGFLVNSSAKAHCTLLLVIFKILVKLRMAKKLYKFGHTERAFLQECIQFNQRKVSFIFLQISDKIKCKRSSKILEFSTLRHLLRLCKTYQDKIGKNKILPITTRTVMKLHLMMSMYLIDPNKEFG